MANTELEIKLLSENATVPTRGSELAAGLDLYASEDKIIYAKTHDLVNTDISVVIPKGYYGRIAPRSGFSLKYQSDIGAGVIDADYRGTLKVMIFNHQLKNWINIKKGERIAQLIIEKICYPIIKVVDELSDTNRGENGFGSTGTN